MMRLPASVVAVVVQVTLVAPVVTAGQPVPGFYDPEAITGLRAWDATDVDAFNRITIKGDGATLTPSYRWSIGSAPDLNWAGLDAVSPFSDFGIFLTPPTVGPTNRYSPATGIERLPGITGYHSSGQALTGDGNTVLINGIRIGVGSDAFLRWTPGIETVKVADGRVSDITPDGRFVSGAVYSTQPGIGYEAVRFNADGSHMPLGLLPGAWQSTTVAISHDGESIVGTSEVFDGVRKAQPFRWTADGVLIGLGDVPNGNGRCYPRDMNADGSVIAGLGSNRFTAQPEPFVWTEQWGMRTLRDILANDFHFDVSKWDNMVINAVSPDGTVITGYGRKLTPGAPGKSAFVVVLPSPAGTSLLAFSACLAPRRRRAA